METTNMETTNMETTNMETINFIYSEIKQIVSTGHEEKLQDAFLLQRYL